MKLLLDESVDVDFRHDLVGHDVSTVTYMKWNGMKNGALLAQAAAHGFEARITTDKNIEYQQNVSTLPCPVVILDVRSSDIDDLRPLVPSLLTALASLKPNCVVHVA